MVMYIMIQHLIVYPTSLVLIPIYIHMKRMEDERLLTLGDEILVQETQDPSFPATYIKT